MECKWKLEDLKRLCKYENVKCSGTKSELCRRLSKHFSLLGDNEMIAKGVYSPKKYFKGLDEKQKIKRIEEIKKNKKLELTNPKAYKFFKTDYDDKGKLIPTKKSSYTLKFHELFPNLKTLKDISDETGISLNIIKKVYNKGLGAYRTGHRPGASASQWGYARVYSFILKGCTFYGPDHYLAVEAMEQSPKAKKHYSKMSCMCIKNCKL